MSLRTSLAPSRLALRSLTSLPSASYSTAPPPTASTSAPLPMSWPDYLSTRHRRRRYAQLTSIPTTLGATLAAAQYFGNLEADPSQLIMGIEPVFVYAGATMGCMGAGFLVGPTIGGLLFKAMNSSKTEALEEMDKRFFEHIKARRVDPSFQSVNNPTPDYYGEKISSIKTYRQWLRDQSAYNRKALHGMKDVSDE